MVYHQSISSTYERACESSKICLLRYGYIFYIIVALYATIL